MMRPCLFLAAIVLGANAYNAPATMPPAWCGVQSITVADELMDSIIYIWQGVLRCGHGHNKAECSVDVSYAIQAVTKMINTMNAAINGCGRILDGTQQCNIAIGELTASMAGVAGASSAIAEDCPKTSIQPVSGIGEAMSGTSGNFPHNLATCIIDSKKLIFSVMKVSVAIADASTKCGHDGQQLGQMGHWLCNDAIVDTLVAVGGMGEWIAGVVGTCTKPDNQAAKCAADVLGLLRQLGEMGDASSTVDSSCDSSSRLYLENGEAQAPIKDNLPTFALAMLLPLTAVMSFVAGRRMAKSQRTPTYDSEAGTQGELLSEE